MKNIFDSGRKAIKLIACIAGIAAGGLAVLFYVYYPDKPFLTAGSGVFSVFLLTLFFFMQFETLRVYSKKRSTIMGLNLFLAAGLFMFIVFIINMIIAQYSFRFDFSSGRRFTISKESEKILKGLSEDVNIIVFSREKSPSFNQAEGLLETYRHLSRKINYFVVDPDKNPALSGKYGITKYDTVVVSAKGDRFIKAEGIGEGTITNSIIKLIRGSTKTIYFVEGHGEHSISDTSREGYSLLKDGLEAIGYPVKSLFLLGLKKMPDDTGLIVIGGPKYTFEESEIKILSEYFGSGGAMVILNESTAAPGMDRLMRGMGVSMIPGHLLDPTSYLTGGDVTTLLIKDYPRTIVTENFRLPTVFPSASAVSVDVEMKSLYEYADIVRTSRNAYIGGNKNAGIYKIAISVTGIKGAGQMVVFGDSDFITNLYYSFPGNSTLFRNIADFMMGARGLVTVVPQDNFVPMYLDKNQSNAIYYFSLFGIPGMVLVCGLFIWFRRRRL